MADPEQAAQAPLEEQRNVFVVTLWLETDSHGAPFWRGHITHIPSNVRVSIQRIAQMSAFIRRYLQIPE